jgi:hypothetical protein
MSFESYTDCVLRAFILHTKQSEIVKRKKEILDEIADFHNFVPNTVLYVGFNPAILADVTPNITVTEISQAAQDFLKSKNVEFNFVQKDKLLNTKQKFDSVVALDEYFTFASTDNLQKNKVTEICNLASEYIITTCRDYKNQDFKDREFSSPALIRDSKSNTVFLEFHNHDIQDRNFWQSTVYQINGTTLVTAGPFNRRSMFFKQLAKFSHDTGAVSFSVHKNLMYKSLIKKNYEHVISIRFDNGS